MIVMGIESSCDETACGIVNEKKEILGSVVWSQYDEHRRFGGVVPEIAARAHLEQIDILITEAMRQANVGFQDLSAIAVAAGPGLIGGVLVGAMTAKAIAWARQLPFIAVNHLSGHALMARMTEDIEFPYLLLLVSGGHCQILAVESPNVYVKLGGTVDDSAGEAFDKVAKMLDIGYPGGPAVDRLAAQGNPKRFVLPKPMKGRPGCDFSFSGLKTAVRMLIDKQAPLSQQDKADICAAFQATVICVIEDRLKHAIKLFKQRYPQGKHLVVSGGVAANTALRAALKQLAAQQGMIFSAPPVSLCTDNGVMIAWAGLERFRLGLVDTLDFKARPRWPLDSLSETN
ncbi:MAG: tRNA (adenosine(37)-N6)-threonylcarbamoyltransferase complex transferase subunit TsaD [Alphaproteobacteria bacterium]|nr:tRNA (adenosine(37)-N6)-threonylcarbamoyltransferase complex transferase subunit TsaD [Alphaproteobacteria bacterium]